MRGMNRRSISGGHLGTEDKIQQVDTFEANLINLIASPESTQLSRPSKLQIGPNFSPSANLHHR